MRLLIFVTFIFIAPAFLVAITTFLFLTKRSHLTRTRKTLASLGGAGLFLVMAFVQESELGFHVASGLILVATIVFVVLSTCVRGLALPRLIGITVIVAVAIVGGTEVVATDGFRGAMCSTILADHTEYAPTYSASGFDRVRAGMDIHEVETLVGEPVEQWTIPSDPAQLYWRWTKSRDGSHYYRYRVARFRDGRLEEKTAFFFCRLD